MRNSLINTRITSLYVSQPSTVVFACKTVTFRPDLQVSVGPRHDVSICACTTACLASELLVSMGLSLHLWFCMQNSYFWNRITNLYGYLTSPFVLYMQNRVISTRKLVSMGPSPHLWFYAFKTATLGPKLHVSMCPTPHL